MGLVYTTSIYYIFIGVMQFELTQARVVLAWGKRTKPIEREVSEELISTKYKLTVIVKFCSACMTKLETTRPSATCMRGPYVLNILATRTATFSCFA